MTIDEYLEQRTNELQRRGRRIKNARVFDFNYMPASPVMRREAKPLIDGCLRYVETGIPNHLFVFGSRGSGKTLTVCHVGTLLSRRHGVRVQYVNCRHSNTSFKILAHLLDARPHGVSLDELWHRFLDTVTGPLIVILDEIDLLSSKDRHKDILYLLSRSPKPIMTILLSNHPRMLNTLDESVRSSLQPELIHFRNYDADEVLAIIRERARAGLVAAGREQAPLPQIAALTVRLTASDVRVAIKTLYYAALEPEAELERLFNRARRDLVIEIITALNDRHLFILRATTASSDRERLVKAVYARYRKLSSVHGEEPFSYVHFYASLSYLQSIGLLLLTSSKVGRAFTNRIEPMFDAGVLDRVWSARLG